MRHYHGRPSVARRTETGRLVDAMMFRMTTKEAETANIPFQEVVLLGPIFYIPFHLRQDSALTYQHTLGPYCRCNPLVYEDETGGLNYVHLPKWGSTRKRNARASYRQRAAREGWCGTLAVGRMRW